MSHGHLFSTLSCPQNSDFFVEDDYERNLPRRLNARERAAAIARERQQMIKEDLSSLVAEEYQDDILRHMEYMELETLPDVASIDIQTEVQWYMRPYLLDFLIEAHVAFRLLPETLHLTINLLDRYCSKRVVYKRHYQLVGCAALQIAAKYGDRKDRVPTIRELKNMCCSLYDDDMFLQMEYHVLSTLNWTIGHPTIDAFLQIALSEVPYDAEVEHMTLYLCEIALFHKDFVSVQPSTMARSALALTRCILGRQQSCATDWAAQYDANVVTILSQRIQQPSQVVSRKYASSQWSSVSASLDIFLEQQALMAQVYPPTPVTETPAPVVQNECYGTQPPQTPVKPQYSASAMYGVLTPPITPENEYFVPPKPASILPSQRPVTPSYMAVKQPQFYSYQQSDEVMMVQ